MFFKVERDEDILIEKSAIVLRQGEGREGNFNVGGI